MLKKASVLGIVIALIITAFGSVFLTSCTKEKPEESTTEIQTEETSLDEGDDEEDQNLEGLSVDDEYKVTIDENQGVDGF